MLVVHIVKIILGQDIPKKKRYLSKTKKILLFSIITATIIISSTLFYFANTSTEITIKKNNNVTTIKGTFTSIKNIDSDTMSITFRKNMFSTYEITTNRYKIQIDSGRIFDWYEYLTSLENNKLEIKYLDIDNSSIKEIISAVGIN